MTCLLSSRTVTPVRWSVTELNFPNRNSTTGRHCHESSAGSTADHRQSRCRRFRKQPPVLRLQKRGMHRQCLRRLHGFRADTQNRRTHPFSDLLHQQRRSGNRVEPSDRTGKTVRGNTGPGNLAGICPERQGKYANPAFSQSYVRAPSAFSRTENLRVRRRLEQHAARD